MLEVLDGDALLAWGRLCVAELSGHCEEINRLNVFPVADADTGTNLLFTMRAAVDAAERAESRDAHAVAAAMATGATYGARGNSGIILAQVLRGIAEATRHGPLTATTLRDALDQAAVLARRAVSVPVEGTVVTVATASARAAAVGPVEASIAEVARAAADGAAVALRATPEQLPVLGAAGVVDAGARGLVLLLDALVVTIDGNAPDRTVHPPAILAPPPEPSATAGDRYEVMFRIADSDDTRIGRLRAALGRIGDSVTVGGDAGTGWTAHVHTVDAGAAVEAGIAAGRVHGVQITAFTRYERDAPGGARGILAVVAGDGAAELFAAEGATVLRSDRGVGGTELLAAIRAMPQREILVLPNGALPAQELVAVGVAAREGRREVLMLPSSSAVQGLAALAVHDPGRVAVDDVFAMSEAAANTRWAALRVASERALTLVGTCAPGEGLGLIGPEVVVIEPDPLSAGIALVDRMLGLGGELVTLLLGAEASSVLVDELCAHLAARHPGVEVTAYPGGQPGDLVQLGVE